MQMVQRLTITIPDDLNERLQIIKERLNISRVCQMALDLAIQIEETKDRTDISAMKKAIARLRKQKQEAGARWKPIGFNDGLKNATDDLDYKLLKYLGEGGDINEQVITIDKDIQQLSIPDWLELISKEKYWDERGDFDFDIYVKGWVEGVTHVWEEIKDLL